MLIPQKYRGLSEQKMLPKKSCVSQFIIVICLVVVVLNSFTREFLYFVAVANLLISLIYGSHENSNKNGKAGEAKIGAFMSHLRWPFLIWYQDAGNEAVGFDSVNVCRASKHLINVSHLNTDRFRQTRWRTKVVEALLNFEEGYPFDGDQVCVSRTPRRPDLPYINPQIEDTHPFPLILSEIASEHQNNVYPSPPA
ncbi:conserved hypothetical protein [Trichinella spiralis]|nr:conserved hypothetical protein [Trichinella spiralis]